MREILGKVESKNKLLDLIRLLKVLKITTLIQIYKLIN
jgi:hypothetical protein